MTCIRTKAFREISLGAFSVIREMYGFALRSEIHSWGADSMRGGKVWKLV